MNAVRINEETGTEEYVYCPVCFGELLLGAMTKEGEVIEPEEGKVAVHPCRMAPFRLSCAGTATGSRSCGRRMCLSLRGRTLRIRTRIECFRRRMRRAPLLRLIDVRKHWELKYILSMQKCE